MALDTIAQSFKVECCWVQTVGSKKRPPQLAARRGFTQEMQAEIASMDLRHSFNKQIIGTGQKIVIPDLSSDGKYGLASFRNAGYRWLVAVPLLTYRVHGVLGMASRDKKRLHKETAELTMVIASLIGAALNRAILSRPAPDEKKSASEKPAEPEKLPSTVKDNKPEEKPPESTSSGGETKSDPKPDDGFSRHVRRMKTFRQAHR